MTSIALFVDAWHLEHHQQQWFAGRMISYPKFEEWCLGLEPNLNRGAAPTFFGSFPLVDPEEFDVRRSSLILDYGWRVRGYALEDPVFKDPRTPYGLVKRRQKAIDTYMAVDMVSYAWLYDHLDVFVVVTVDKDMIPPIGYVRGNFHPSGAQNAYPPARTPPLRGRGVQLISCQHADISDVLVLAVADTE